MGTTQEETAGQELGDVFSRYQGEKSELIPILQDVQDVLGYINRLWRRGSRVYGSTLARRYGVPTRTMHDYLERLIAQNHLARRDGQYGYYPPS